MSPTMKRLTVAQYDQMVENGILPQTNRLELIEGRIVEKARQSPPQAFSSESCRDALASLVPTGWHVRCGNPVRVPARDSEPEPDVSVVRGQIRDYCDHHPGPRTSPWSSRSSGGTSPRNAGWPRRMAAAASRCAGS